LRADSRAIAHEDHRALALIHRVSEALQGVPALKLLPNVCRCLWMGFKVCIIGAGTGGLCLAQGLKQDGVEVEVFERDRTPTDRLQGYRLTINATGRRALRECLPAEIYDRLVSNGAKPSDSVTSTTASTACSRSTCRTPTVPTPSCR